MSLRKSGKERPAKGDSPAKGDNLKAAKDTVMTSVKDKNGVFNTTTMIKRLNELFYGIDPEKSDPKFVVTASIMDTRSRHTERAITDYPKAIDNALDDFHLKLLELASLPSKSAMTESQTKKESSASFLAQGQERIEQRQTLTGVIKTLVTQNQQLIHEALEAYKAGKSKEEVNEIFAKVIKQVDEANKQIIKFKGSQEDTLKILNSENTKLTAVLNAERTKLGIPIPSEIPGEKLGRGT